MPLTRKLAAEFIGTFWLVLGGCGSTVPAAAFPLRLLSALSLVDAIRQRPGPLQPGGGKGATAPGY
jgi:hypothetical protein